MLISRVTDPRNFSLLGIPPKDVIEDLGQALVAHGIDVDSFFEAACKVSGEWKYDRSKSRLVDRIDQKYCHERAVPLRSRTLAESLNPQPDAHVVFQRLLDWIDRCDVASQLGHEKPEFASDGNPIFPDDDEPWWLTDISKRISSGAAKQDGDEDGPATCDEDEGAEQKEVSDEDPVSEPEQVGGCASSSNSHRPNIAWNA